MREGGELADGHDAAGVTLAGGFLGDAIPAEAFSLAPGEHDGPGGVEGNPLADAELG